MYVEGDLDVANHYFSEINLTKNKVGEFTLVLVMTVHFFLGFLEPEVAEELA